MIYVIYNIYKGFVERIVRLYFPAIDNKPNKCKSNSRSKTNSKNHSKGSKSKAIRKLSIIQADGVPVWIHPVSLIHKYYFIYTYTNNYA